VPVVATIPVTELLNPAKASRRPTEQRAKPIERRELKKAAREVEFVFMDVCPFPFLRKISRRVAEIAQSQKELIVYS
jgi:phage terminase Nu1 subunit (DNA packaging protein)